MSLEAVKKNVMSKQKKLKSFWTISTFTLKRSLKTVARNVSKWISNNPKIFVFGIATIVQTEDIKNTGQAKRRMLKQNT